MMNVLYIASLQSDPNLQRMTENIDAVEDGGLAFLVIVAVLVVITLAGLWKTFTKANIPGVLAIIPFVHLFFLPKVAGKPAWWGVLYLIPVVNIVVAILVSMGISERFNRGIGTTLGLIFLSPIFFCLLGFGSAQWTPPPAEG